MYNNTPETFPMAPPPGQTSPTSGPETLLKDPTVPPRDAASALIELARQRARGGGDNISLAVVKLVEVAPKPPRSDFPRLGG